MSALCMLIIQRLRIIFSLRKLSKIRPHDNDKKLKKEYNNREKKYQENTDGGDGFSIYFSILKKNI